MISIKDLINFANKGRNYYFYCSIFLDLFYLADNETRIEMIQEEPDWYDHVDHFYYCDVLVIAYKLANNYQLPIPNWVHDKKYILEEPYLN